MQLMKNNYLGGGGTQQNSSVVCWTVVSQAKSCKTKLWFELSRRRHKPADKITDDIGMTHDDLIAVLFLLGVSPVDVAAEGCLNASSVFVVLLEDGKEVESQLCHMRGFSLNPIVLG